MKKRTIISLIVAAALILAGGVMLVLGLSFAGEATAAKPSEKTYVVSESFESIQVDTGICDVTLAKTDGPFRAVCPETEKLSYIVIVEDGVLKISAMDMRRWYDFIGINVTKMEMTVYLPEHQYQALRIETNTGDIEVPGDFSFEAAEVFSDTGDIEFAATVTERIIGSTSTGDIDIDGVSSVLLDIGSDTGEIKLENIQSGGEFSLKTTTGEILVKNVTCHALTCKSDTGDTELDGVLAKENLQISTTTGDVRIENSDAGFVNIVTGTGDVTGNFLSPKWFIPESDTGDIDVPLSREGGECLITTDTGDIIFS